MNYVPFGFFIIECLILIFVSYLKALKCFNLLLRERFLLKIGSNCNLRGEGIMEKYKAYIFDKIILLFYCYTKTNT